MVLVLWMTERWNRKTGWVEALLIGLAAGMQVFIKPAGFASILIFIFWNAFDRESFGMKWRLWKEKLPQVLAVFLLFGTGITLRMLFPAADNDNLFNDYVEHMRAFYFLAPNLWEVLFSVKNGWLIYTPVVLISIPGFYILAERNKPLFYATFLYCLVFLLMLASSPHVAAPVNYSQAKMTEIYAVLFLPVGYFASWVLGGRWIRRSLSAVLIIFLLFLNLFQTWQYRQKILNPWFVTPEYYRAVFLRTHAGDRERALLDFYRMDEASWNANEPMEIRNLSYNDFEGAPGSYGGHISDLRAAHGRCSFVLDTGLRFTPTFVVKLKDLPQKTALGIRTTSNVYYEGSAGEHPAAIVISLKHQGALYRYRTMQIDALGLPAQQWNEVKLDYVIPRIWDPEDELISHIWYQGNGRLFVDDLKVEVYGPKDK
jgi:hypothetical protein